MSITRVVSAFFMLIALGLTGCKSADGTYHTSSADNYASAAANYPETGNGGSD